MNKRNIFETFHRDFINTKIYILHSTVTLQQLQFFEKVLVCLPETELNFMISIRAIKISPEFQKDVPIPLYLL